jgi:hypothetical protein
MPKPTKTTKTTELHYFSFSSDVLIKSCPLPKEMIHSINAKTHTLTIEAVQALSLSEYLKKTKKHMPYHDVEKMIHMIGKQLQRMETMDKGIASFNLDDISVFYTHPPRVTGSRASRGDTDTDSSASDDTDDDATADATTTDVTATATVIHFALTNDDKVCEFDDAQQIKITTPYKPEYTSSSSSSHKPGHNKAFISPEFTDFISKKTLPYSIHFKSGYYSFGLLCAYCFVSKTAVIAAVAPATNADAAAVDAVLAPIIHTKIYWFLKRVLDENPTARRYLCS